MTRPLHEVADAGYGFEGVPIRFAYTMAMASFCIRLRPEALELQTTSITTNQCELLPARLYTKPARCRLKHAYANAHATYAVCIGAYAWGIVFLVELSIFLHPEKNAAQIE